MKILKEAKQDIRRSAVKVDFSKLIGNKYPLEIKMAILDWMLKTGKGHDYQYGWYRDGVNKSLVAYSANNHNAPVCLPKDGDFNLFFDAIFARAVFSDENKSLKKWREKESIKPDKYRMLKFIDTFPNCEQRTSRSLINDILKFEWKYLKKEFHHPKDPKRTKPKILSMAIFTTGNGWIVQYQFSFKECDYEPGWTNGYRQNENESIWEFLKRSYDELCAVVDGS